MYIYNSFFSLFGNIFNMDDVRLHILGFIHERKRGMLKLVNKDFKACVNKMDNLCELTATNGSVHHLNWARTHGCPLDIGTCLRIAQRRAVSLGLMHYISPFTAFHC
jgi:hypothetical protein